MMYYTIMNTDSIYHSQCSQQQVYHGYASYDYCIWHKIWAKSQIIIAEIFLPTVQYS